MSREVALALIILHTLSSPRKKRISYHNHVYNKN